jgi:superfamily II DNA or RNA helicase
MNKSSCIFCNSENKFKDDHLFFEKENIELNNNSNLYESKIENEKNINIEKYNNNKNVFLKEFIENINKESKIIIFSDYSHVFHYIIDICNKYNIKYVDLDKGNIKDIDNVVNEYKYGNAQILLSNSTLFGCGMNFENASTILFLHKMESEIEKQVIGRAQRMGRKSVLEIIYLQYENELEYKRKAKNNYINNYELNKDNILEGYYNEQQYYNLIENIQHLDFNNDNHIKILKQLGSILQKPFIGPGPNDFLIKIIKENKAYQMIFIGGGEMREWKQFENRPIVLQTIERSITNGNLWKIGLYEQNNPNIKRKYTTDFEKYQNPEEIAIYISILPTSHHHN